MDATMAYYDSIFKNVKMGSEAVCTVLPKVTDENLRMSLTTQLNSYEQFALDAKNALSSRGEAAKDEGLGKKIPLRMGINMNTLADSSTSHIAEMMINGSVMSVIELTRKEHELTPKGCEQGAIDLGRKIVQFEEGNVETMKGFL